MDRRAYVSWSVGVWQNKGSWNRRVFLRLVDGNSPADGHMLYPLQPQ